MKRSLKSMLLTVRGMVALTSISISAGIHFTGKQTWKEIKRSIAAGNPVLGAKNAIDLAKAFASGNSDQESPGRHIAEYSGLSGLCADRPRAASESFARPDR
jgi:hypothetical protein